jgi:arylsulfatase A-like enzyme
MGEQAANRKPFLAAVWFPSPHGPHKATPENAAPYAKYGGARANYYGELAGVDHAMGRLRKALREMGIAKNTMLWFCSDNGGAFALSTGGLPGGKKWLTEGGTRVPGILEWPARVPKPFVTTVPACTMDLYPTVLDLLGIEMPDQIEPIDGISLLPLIDGKMDRRPKPIPLVSGQAVRLIDNEYILQKGRLFRFDEEEHKDVDITDDEPEVFERLTAWEDAWRERVKKDQAVYTVKRR